MVVKKKMLVGLFALGMTVASSLTYAEVATPVGPPLTIVNNTSQDSTTKTNSIRLCSSVVLGAAGVTHHNSTNVVSGENVKRACYFYPADCIASIYMTSDCTGSIIAKVTFDTLKGIKTIAVSDPAYSLSGSGFSITIDGGPKLAKN